MAGAECQTSLEDLYEVAGRIRANFIELQQQVAAKSAKE